MLDSDNEQVRLRAAAEVLKVTNTVSEPRASGPTQVEVQVANFFQQLERPYIDATECEDR